MKNTFTRLHDLIAMRGLTPRIANSELLVFEHPLKIIGTEMAASGIAWLKDTTLQVRISIPIRLTPSEMKETFLLAAKMNFTQVEGSWALDSEGGVYHACVSTRRREPGPSEEDVNYCLDHAAAMAACFGEMLLRDELWRIGIGEVNQRDSGHTPHSWN